jgi:hypothetical protein
MSSALKWGLITGMVYVLFSLGSNLMGLQAKGGMIGILVNIVLMLITFFTIYMGIKEIRDADLNGEMTTGIAIRKGMQIALIAGLLLAVFSVLYSTVIDPDMTQRMIDAAESQFDENNTPESAREMTRSVMKFMSKPFITFPFAIIWVCFWGLLKSLVAGAMLKNPPAPMAPPSATPSVPSV